MLLEILDLELERFDGDLKLLIFLHDNLVDLLQPVHDARGVVPKRFASGQVLSVMLFQLLNPELMILDLVIEVLDVLVRGSRLVC